MRLFGSVDVHGGDQILIRDSMGVDLMLSKRPRFFDEEHRRFVHRNAVQVAQVIES